MANSADATWTKRHVIWSPMWLHSKEVKWSLHLPPLMRQMIHIIWLHRHNLKHTRILQWVFTRFIHTALTGLSPKSLRNPPTCLQLTIWHYQITS